VSGNDGRQAGDQAGGPGGTGNQSSPGGIPPSFGASAPKPPKPSEFPAPASGADGPAITGPVPPLPAQAASAPVPPPPLPGPPTSAPAPDPGPGTEPDDASSVGWYPSTPTAGPFASPAAPPRRRVPGVSRPGKSGAGTSPAGPGKSRPGQPRVPGGRTLSWGGRSALMNALLFGGAPLALAGILVAAFVVVAPGKGSASSLGFKAAPAPSTQQISASALATDSASPSASPSVHKKKHPRATSSASLPDKVVPRPTATKKKAAPRRTHKAGGGRVTAHNLGAPDFSGYCQHIGHHDAETVASNAYGWRCSLYPSLALNVGSVCAYSYHLSTSQVIDVSTNFGDPNAWQCWRVNRYLGALDFASYCAQAGQGTSKLVANNAYGWYCTSPSAPVDTNVACDTLYHVSGAVSRFTLYTNPSSWQCWG